MASAALFSRWLLRASSSSRLLLLQNPNPKSHLLLKPFRVPNNHFPNPSPIPFLIKPFSTNPNPSPNPSPSPSPSTSPNGFQHQEIEGPTVERDDSALANETREVLYSLRKSIYDLSSSLALLGVAHLGLGAYIAYASSPSSNPSNVVSIQGFAAFAFPFSLAFLMRRSLKPMSFFQKMEEQGRLQILTLSLQSAKSLKVLFLRIRVASVCCVVGLSAGTLVTLWLRFLIYSKLKLIQRNARWLMIRTWTCGFGVFILVRCWFGGEDFKEEVAKEILYVGFAALAAEFKISIREVIL